ncbi:MAG: hypothetical protein IJQ43_06870, partial [Oscillospiraceae bacterium]|nr:hypothetical protein [Oscillospiraceae bacterium]
DRGDTGITAVKKGRALRCFQRAAAFVDDREGDFLLTSRGGNDKINKRTPYRSRLEGSGA